MALSFKCCTILDAGGYSVDTFLWLALGHLVGDWLLQNDWMARGKRISFFTWPGMVHYAIYTAVVMGVLWLSGSQGRGAALYLAVGAVVFVSHWLIDAADLARGWMRLYRQTDREAVRVMVDQTLHLLVLAGLVLGM